MIIYYYYILLQILFIQCYGLDDIERRVQSVKLKLNHMEQIFGDLGISVANFGNRVDGTVPESGLAVYQSEPQAPVTYVDIQQNLIETSSQNDRKIEVGNFIFELQKLEYFKNLESLTWKIKKAIHKQNGSTKIIKGYFFGKNGPENGWYIYDKQLHTVNRENNQENSDEISLGYKIEEIHRTNRQFFKLVIVIDGNISKDTIIQKINELNEDFPMEIVITGIYKDQHSFFDNSKNIRHVLENRLNNFRTRMLQEIFYGKTKNKKEYKRVQRAVPESDESSEEQTPPVHLDENDASDFISKHFQKEQLPDIRPNLYVLFTEISDKYVSDREQVTDALSFSSSCCSSLFNFSIFSVSRFSLRKFSMIFAHEIRHSLGFGHGVGMEEIYDDDNDSLENESSSVENRQQQIKSKLRKQTKEKIKQFKRECFEI
ncbi:60S ribosomal protein L37 [Pseudoloma neurophilia]|uniref:60S ribosomal protein L37 n=1 Tax=Pseudoloma neurophilia TaxID=146866 RepID=A0A0R0LXA8_9MICR|nr:60S ribosomal protein L37 [Pseudoloma neurophilia]